MESESHEFVFFKAGEACYPVVLDSCVHGTTLDLSCSLCQQAEADQDQNCDPHQDADSDQDTAPHTYAALRKAGQELGRGKLNRYAVRSRSCLRIM